MPAQTSTMARKRYKFFFSFFIKFKEVDGIVTNWNLISEGEERLRFHKNNGKSQLKIITKRQDVAKNLSCYREPEKF